MQTQPLYYQLFYSNPEDFRETIKNRSINRNIHNINKLNLTESINERNKFYNDNNYVYFKFLNSFTSFKCNDIDLPEWYNTERDQDIVNVIESQYAFYDSSMSIETEDHLEEEYQNDINENTDEFESSGDEWIGV